ncbi:MAG: hypothetical protein FJZ92_14440 [Chloroflexi bacterium]|nr:hypothetical protein [Chloroflexota bacterium]
MRHAVNAVNPHLTHLFMDAGSLAAARRLWVDLLGLELLEDRGAYIRVGGGGGFAIGIEEARTPGEAHGQGPEITMRVPDVDALVERLRGAGVEIVSAPAEQPWGARHAWLCDPDGRLTSIYSSERSIM